MLVLASFALAAAPLTLTDSGHALVHATVDGVEHRFVLDTGANISTFAPQLVPEAKVMRELDLHGAGGGARAQLVRPVVLEVEGEARALPYALAMPPDDLVDIAPDLMGIVGLDVMRHGLVRIDAPGGTVDWTAPEPTGSPVKLDKLRGKLLATELVLPGGTVTAVVDLGAATTILNPAAAALGAGRPVGGEAGSVTGIDGTSSATDRQELASCELWGATVAPCVVDVVPLEVFETLRLDGGPAAIVGLDLLGRQPFTLDARKRRVWPGD